jgi:hypothetical protein
MSTFVCFVRNFAIARDCNELSHPKKSDISDISLFYQRLAPEGDLGQHRRENDLWQSNRFSKVFVAALR